MFFMARQAAATLAGRPAARGRSSTRAGSHGAPASRASRGSLTGAGGYNPQRALPLAAPLAPHRRRMARADGAPRGPSLSPLHSRRPRRRPRALRLRGAVEGHLLSWREDRLLGRRRRFAHRRRLRAPRGRPAPDDPPRGDQRGPDPDPGEGRSLLRATVLLLLPRSRNRAHRGDGRPRRTEAQAHDPDAEREPLRGAGPPRAPEPLPEPASRARRRRPRAGPTADGVHFRPGHPAQRPDGPGGGSPRGRLGGAEARARLPGPQTFAGITSTSWITDVGEVVREESPLGLIVVRETPGARRMALAVPGQHPDRHARDRGHRARGRVRIDDPTTVERLRLRVEGVDLRRRRPRGRGRDRGRRRRRGARCPHPHGRPGRSEAPFLPWPRALHRERRAGDPRGSGQGRRRRRGSAASAPSASCATSTPSSRRSPP